jgi:hypothetical protein
MTRGQEQGEIAPIYFNMLPMIPGEAEIKKKLIGATQLRPEDFEYRWTAV